MYFYEKEAGMGRETWIITLTSHIPVLAVRKGRERRMSRHLQIEFPQRDVGGLPSPKAHHVSLIPVLYTVGGWGCWTTIANFFHLAGGRGWKKNTSFCFSFLNYHY